MKCHSLYLIPIIELVEFSICNVNHFRLSTLQNLCKINFVEYFMSNVNHFRLSTLQRVYFLQSIVLNNVQIKFLRSHGTAAKDKVKITASLTSLPHNTVPGKVTKVIPVDNSKVCMN